MDVDVVDVPGLRHPARLAGARLERLWAFAPPTGAALSVTLLSHLDVACIGVAADTAAVDDPELLAECLRRGFDEVVAAGGDQTWSDEPSHPHATRPATVAETITVPLLS
jgi:diacylglycerol O-acyltransferase / wax synthase